MTTVRFNPLAEKDLIDAANYLDGEKEGLGSEFLEEIAYALDFLLRFPRASPRVRGSIRSLVISRFSYSIVYRPLKTGGLRVLAIVHHKRQPEYWRGRR